MLMPVASPVASPISAQNLLSSLRRAAINALRLSAFAGAALLCLGAPSAEAAASLTSFTLSISSATTVNLGQPVTITAVVTGDSTDGAPTGNLGFYVWNAVTSPGSRTSLCSGARVTSGLTSTYTCTTSSLGGGLWNFYAQYNDGDNPYSNTAVESASNGPLTVNGPTFTVNTLADSTDSPDNCATSGTGTQCSLRDALNDTNLNNQGGTINFQSGLTGTITLGSSLPGTSGEVITINGPGPSLLTISGGGQYSGFYFEGDSHSVAISGLTIEDGLSTGNGSGGGGIGLYSNYSLTVNNCVFIGNQATKYNGGAIYNGGGYGGPGAGTIVSNSTFVGNSALYGGGAIFVGGGPLTITNSTFSGNTSDTGGAIYSYGGTITNSTFNGNAATNGSSGLGGAIEMVSGSLVANNDIFSNNTALQYGAGIELYGATMSASNNVFYNNLDGGTTEEDCNIFGTGTCTGSSVPPENGNVEASSNPLTLPLSNYGGVAETYLPQPGSAAICAGSASLAVDASSNPLSTDERGWAVSPGYWQCASGSVDAGAVQTNYIQVQYAADGSDAYCNPNNYCTLRVAVQTADAAGYGDISFSSSISLPATINIGTPGGGLGSTLGISGQVNIVGPGANQLTISGDDDMNMGTVLSVGSGAQLFLDGLTISSGYLNSGSGGGINNQGTLNVLDGAISGNVAASGASGAGISSSGTLSLTDSTVSGNQIANGSGSGGGIYSTGTLTMIESTVAGNSLSVQSTGGGGGLFIGGGSATLTASTVSGNSAPQLCPGGPSCMGGSGGGIYNAGTLTATNSIVAGNTAGNDNDAVGAFEAASADNLIGDGTGTSGITNGTQGNMVGTTGTPVNAMLSGVQGNGIDATLSTMIPLPGSPAICAAELANIPSGTTTDERGYPLVPTSGYCPTGFVDAGAVQTNYTNAAFVQQPTNTLLNTAISPDPTVAVYETDTLLSNNNVDQVNGVPITLTYSDPANLTGTLTETTGSGVADFSGLTPTAYESGASFNFILPVYGSTSFAATSNNFSVFGPFAQLAVSAPSSVTAGTSFQFTVTAEDAAGNTVTDYNDTLSFYSSDFGTGLVLPVSGPMVNGVGTFTATLVTEGNQTLGATDTSLSISGTTNIFVNATTAVGLQVSGYPTTWYAGATAQVTVDEVDQYGNVLENFTGPVTLTTTDNTATVTQFSSYNLGVAAYSVVFNAQGTQSITVSAASLPSASETGIQIGTVPSFVVTVATDTTDGQDTASDCTNQSLSGATPDASCSLRDAIWAADYLGAGNITFSPSGFSGATTITLTAPQASTGDFGAIPIGANITLTGPTGSGGSANLVTVSGPTPAAPSTGSSVFYVYGYPYALELIGPDSISNLNITNGDGSQATGDSSGTGGISSEAPTFTLTNCNLSANNGDFAGALYNYSGQMTVTGSSFSNNTTTGAYQPDAAAIFSDTSTSTPPFVKEHPFASRRNGAAGPIAEASSSTETPKPGFYGTALGGRAGFAARVRPMNAHKSGAQCAGCDMAHARNSSMLTSHLSAIPESTPGGGSYSGPTLTVSNTTFTGNQGGAAGGIFDAGDLVTITNSTFAGNTASDGGGALVAYEYGSVTVSNSTFTGNSGSVAGVAFDIAGGQLQIQGSTMAQNSSTGGGGIPVPDAGGIVAYADSYAFLAYDTLINNSSTSAQGIGAIADFGSTDSFVAAFNLTVTGNSGYYGAMLDDSGNESDLENTIASGNTTTDPTAATDGISPDSNGMVQNGGNLISDPGITLAALGNYGGPTQTALPLPGSTAICAGLQSNFANASTNYDVVLSSDQRGDPNTNSTYLISGGGTCVDAGAVQTNYALGFTTQPPSSADAGQVITPAPVVSLTESTLPITAASGAVTMTDSANLLTGTTSETLSSGAASFDNLAISAPTGHDILSATMPLNAVVLIATQATTGISVAATPATLTPSSGALSTSQQFTWNNGVGVTEFQVLIGTTADGSSDLYNSGITTSTSATVPIPPYGDTVYGTLRQLIGGAWQVARYTFTESGSTTAATLTPTTGTLLTSQQFTWNNGSGVTDFQVLLGTTAEGSSDIYNSGITTNTSATVSIPPYGDTVYGTLRQLIGGTWQVTRYTFTEPGATTLATLTPSSGPLSASQQFTWNNGTGETDYQVLIGTTGPGSSDIYNSGITTNTSATVSIPPYGDTVYGTLRQLVSGTWQVTRYTFTEPGATTPATLSPSSGPLSASQQFTWNNGTGETDYQVLIGTTGPGSSDIYNSGITTNTSALVSVPSYGDTVYGTLRQLIGGTWQVTRYTFTEPGATIPATLTPSSGTLLSSQLFTWNNGTGATEYQVFLGTAGSDSSNLYNSGITTSTSTTISTPSNGVTVYGTLRQLIGGAWQVTRYTFTEPAPPAD